MSEEPKQVLVEDGVAAVLGIEEVSAVMACQQQFAQNGRQRRKRHKNQQRSGQDFPREDRHAPHRHTGRAVEQNRRDEVDGHHDRRSAVHQQPDQPEVLSRTGSDLYFGKRRVRRPSRRGGAALREDPGEHGEPTDDEEHDAQADSSAGTPCRARRSAAAPDSWPGRTRTARSRGKSSRCRGG